jgi:ArpU family phage transcriptional regulator
MGRLVQTYFSRLDRKATAENADLVLGDYRHRRQKARRNDVASIGSPSMDGMPKTASVANGQENMVVNHLGDAEFVAKVDTAIECIEDDDQRAVLKLLYISHQLTAEAIQERLHMSNTAYYHTKEDALIAFAEVWPPQPSELLVYRTQRRESD